jgi:long-chain acyl-CoA synthetase
VAAFREGQAFFVERPLWAEIESLARRLPSYKRPSGLHVLTEPLPRTTTRKLQRFRAAELARTLVASADRAPQVLGEPEHPDSPEREIAASIRRLRPAVGPISAGSSLELDLHLDSLERVELLANVERAFGITLPDERSASIYTFRDLADAVRAVSGPRRESADGWRNWKEILNQPFTSEETRFADAYLRPRPLLELFWFCVARAFRLGATVLLRLRVDAPHRLPQGGFLLCPNHVSYLDDVLAPGVLSLPVFRRVFFLGARKYFRNPLLAWLGRNMRVVPVDPDTNLLKALRMGKAGLERGMVLCVFPEGTRSFNGELQPLMKGPAVLASVLGAAVVPVGIAGTFEVLPKSAGFGGLHPVAISVGPPLAPVALDSPESFNERLRSELANAIGRARELRS